MLNFRFEYDNLALVTFRNLFEQSALQRNSSKASCNLMPLREILLVNTTHSSGQQQTALSYLAVIHWPVAMPTLQISAELDEELSRLGAAFTASTIAILDEFSPVTVHVDARPQTAPYFCSAVLTAIFPDSYPAIPAKLSVLKSRGLSAEQASALGEALTSAADEHPRAQALAAFKAAVNFLDKVNTPGPCVVCNGVVDDVALVVAHEPCLHTVHVACVDAMRTDHIRRRREAEVRLAPTMLTAEAERQAVTEAGTNGGCPACASVSDTHS
jgi:hypothetical protein